MKSRSRTAMATTNSGVVWSIRRAFAFRDASSGADGSGAPASGSNATAMLSIAVLSLAALVLVASASASKEAINFFGTMSGSGSLGGQFNNPRDIAVNRTGVGPADPGDIYVADDSNHRIQRFTAAGGFVSAWGADVIQPTKPGDIVGTNPFEICTVASDCKAGAGTGGNGAVTGNGALDNPQSVAVDSDTGQVYVSDRDNRRVNVYDGVGNFLFSVGRDVQDPDGDTVVEVCGDVVGDVCRQGDGGSGAGEIGSTGSSNRLGIAVSPSDGNAGTGSVFLADSQNRRVNTYSLDGTSPASFGSEAVFGFGQPTKVAVDSRGIVYASNSTGNARIERYDSLNANGGGTGFLAPIAAPINETQTIQFTGFNVNDFFTLTCPGGGTTGEIAYKTGVTGRNLIQTGLELSCGGGSVSASGVPPTVTIAYQGAYEGLNVTQMVCTTVSGSGTCGISGESNGSPGPLLLGGEAATAGLAVDPDSDGGGADQDVLHVLRDPLSGNTVIQQFGPSNDPGLTAPPTLQDDQHGKGAGFGGVQGLGINDVSGRLFVSSTENVSGTGFGHRVYIIADALPAPVVTMNPITVKTDTTATFSGTVNPTGGLVSCKYEYSTDQVAWTDVPESECGALSPGGGAQAVSQNVTGLDPNTRYYVRLKATRAFDPSLVTTSPGVKVFDTDAVPPVVTNVGAVQIADTSAKLVGTIDPRHSTTAYVFEYGTTPVLDSSTPPVNIGDGTKPITVTELVQGLKPDTTYFFRLVATNAFGTTASGQKTLHTRATPFSPPTDRAYEMVSPPDKNQGGADQNLLFPIVAFSRDGEAATFCSNALFGDPPGQMGFECAPYLSRRTVDGWKTSNPFPAYCPDDRDGTRFYLNAFLSPNFDYAAITRPESDVCPHPPLDPTAPEPAIRNTYRQDLTADPTDPLSFGLMNSNVTSGGVAFGGGAEDFSHVVYTTTSNQTLDAPVGNFTKFYHWNNGSLSLVSKDTSGAPFTTASSFPTVNVNAGGTPIPSAVSADGERIYFHNQVPNSLLQANCNSAVCHLYMRESDTITHDLSSPECAVLPDCGANASADRFLWANSAGDVALFHSCDKLTDVSTAGAACGETGGKLYRWDLNGAPGHRITDLTVDKEPGDGLQPGVVDIIGASEDGDVVFFVATGQIISGEPTGGGSKVYRVRWNGGSPVVDYLGPYGDGGTGASGNYGGDPNLTRRHVRVTPDGEHLLIRTGLAIDPVADQDSDADFYRWNEDSGWLCVSCQAPGVPSAGHVNRDEVKAAYYRALVSLEPEVSISDDGRGVVFETPDALVPEDVNGEAGCESTSGATLNVIVYTCDDVYEWHDGTFKLISSGTSPSPSVLLGGTRSGRDVFFLTRERLVGWDTDNNTDIYTARIGGGFPEPPPQLPVCEGEACRGQGSSAPENLGAGTAVFDGPGNVQKSLDKPKRCKRGFVKRKGKCVKRAQNRRGKRGHRRAAGQDRRADK